MPNHILNEITLQGHPDRINQLLQTVKFTDGPVGTIDFNKIIPEPPNLPDKSILSSDPFRSISGLPFEETEIKDENGFIVPIRYLDWYSWRVRYWGTKWNSYDYATPNGQNPNTWNYTVVFNTAWSVPESIILELSRMFPDILICLRYAEELLNYNAGYIMYYAGCVVNDESLDVVNKEAAGLTQRAMWNKYYGYYKEEEE